MSVSGYSEDRLGYYARTGRGLWVRSRWCVDTGTVRLGWQVRYEINGPMMVTLDENEEIVGTVHVRNADLCGAPWVDVEPFMSLDRREIIDMGRGDTRGLIESMMRHQARLLAFGFGETSRDVAEWFVCPENGEMIRVGASHLIVGGVGVFVGLDGSRLYIRNCDDGLFYGSVAVEGDDCSHDFSHEMSPSLVSDLLRSSILMG